MEFGQFQLRIAAKDLGSNEIGWEQLYQAINTLIALSNPECCDADEYPTADMFWPMPECIYGASE